MFNLKKIVPEYDNLIEAHPDIIKNQAEQERIAKVNELSEKDEGGNPVIENNKYKFSDDNLKLFNEFLNELENKYSPFYKKAIKDFEKLANEDVEFDFRKIKLSSLPNVDIDELEAIFDLIQEEV